MDNEAARARLRSERESLVGLGHDLAASFDNIVDAAKDSNLDDEHDPEGGTIAAERSLVASLGRTAADGSRGSTGLSPASPTAHMAYAARVAARSAPAGSRLARRPPNASRARGAHADRPALPGPR